MVRCSKSGQADGGDGGFDRGVIFVADPAEQSSSPPQPHRHHVVDADRKRAVDVGDLRQIGDVVGVEAVALDAAGKRLQEADDALEQRRLAGPVGTDDRNQRAFLHGTAEVMHRRVALIAEREIVKEKFRHGFR